MVVLGTKNSACRPRSRGRREAQVKVRLTDHISCENSNVCGLRHRLEATIAYSRTIHPHPDVSLLITGKYSLKLEHTLVMLSHLEPGSGPVCRADSDVVQARRTQPSRFQRCDSKEPTVQCPSKQDLAQVSRCEEPVCRQLRTIQYQFTSNRCMVATRRWAPPTHVLSHRVSN